MCVRVRGVSIQKTKILVCTYDMFSRRWKHYCSLRMLLLLTNTHAFPTLNNYKSLNCKLVNINRSYRDFSLKRRKINVGSNELLWVEDKLCSGKHILDFTRKLSKCWIIYGLQVKRATVRYRNFLVTSFTNHWQYAPRNILEHSNKVVSNHWMICQCTLTKVTSTPKCFCKKSLKCTVSINLVCLSK